MDIDAFLRRIHYAGDRSPSPENLAALQLAFLLSVPFENYDIHWGRPLSVDLVDLEDKIVRRRRGGVCYENNVLFRAALEQLGYEVRYLDGRMWKDDGSGFGVPCEHMVLLVSLDHEYVVDVGNGQGCHVPLPLDRDLLNESEGISYRLSWHDGMRALILRKPDCDWEPRYAFTEEHHEWPDFQGGLENIQTDPNSHFMRNRLATRALVNGRVTLRNMRLFVQENGKNKRHDLTTEDEELKVLRDWFGIVPPPGIQGK